MIKTDKPRKKSANQLLIEALLMNPRNCNWPLEMKMLGRVLGHIPNKDFWFFFSKNHKYTTLIHLLSDIATKNSIVLAFNDYTKNNLILGKSVESPILHQEKVGEDIIVKQQKPKTLKDFISGI